MRIYIPIFYRKQLLCLTALLLSITAGITAYSQQRRGFSDEDSVLWNKKIKSLLGQDTDSTVFLKLKAYNIDLPEKTDTLAKEHDFMGLTSNYRNIDSAAKKNAKFFSRPAIQLGSGYVSYNWTFRSGSDSSFIENNLSQHLISGSFNATIAQAIPIRVTYFERQSNSIFFKDFRDVRVDVDVQRYQQMRMQKKLANFKMMSAKGRDPFLPYILKLTDQKINRYKTLVNDPRVVKQLILSKETLIRKDFADTSLFYRDSVVAKANQFIKLYDTLQLLQAKYERMLDSLKTTYQQAQQKIQSIEQLLSGKALSQRELNQIKDLYRKDDINFPGNRRVYNGIRSLSLGNTLPSQSNLTLQNVNVNGFNVEYNKSNLYLAAAGGLVDFRIRDLLYNRHKSVKQYVYSGRVGYGTKERDHIILTYFRGKKQLFGGDLQTPAANIQGLSLAVQYYILKNTKIYGELAQSGVPYADTSTGKNNSIRFNDDSQRAYAFGFTSSWPRTQTRIEGYYQHTGLNYQSFNSFQYNATTNNWSFKLEQLFWKRQLVLNAGFRKNDFVNPLVLQRYSANTVFKNITLTFRKMKWPVVSIGYLPASQYTAVGNLVYENHYQTFNGTMSHQYKIGKTKANSAFAYSRFFNDSRDSAFVYYNSKNFFFNQSFFFNQFTATAGASVMVNGQYNLAVLEEGIEANVIKGVYAGFSIKINHLAGVETRVGFSTRSRINIKYIGELNLWMEQNYLPSLQNGLFKYEMYNLGLTRYFK